MAQHHAVDDGVLCISTPALGFSIARGSLEGSVAKWIERSDITTLSISVCGGLGGSWIDYTAEHVVPLMETLAHNA
jgi:hypothetical protein